MKAVSVEQEGERSVQDDMLEVRSQVLWSILFANDWEVAADLLLREYHTDELLS